MYSFELVAKIAEIELEAMILIAKSENPGETCLDLRCLGYSVQLCGDIWPARADSILKDIEKVVPGAINAFNDGLKIVEYIDEPEWV